MDLDICAGRGIGRDLHAHVARVAFCAELALVDGNEGDPRGDGNPVVAFLTVDREMLVPELPEDPCGKLRIPALGLLKTKHVGRVREQILLYQLSAQTHRVDVPGRYLQAHGGLCSISTAPMTAMSKRSQQASWARGYRQSLNRSKLILKRPGSGVVRVSTLESVTTVS